MWQNNDKILKKISGIRCFINGCQLSLWFDCNKVLIMLFLRFLFQLFHFVYVRVDNLSWSAFCDYCKGAG